MPRTATLLGLLAMSATLAATSAADPPKVEIIAHRGASFDAPENTLPALEAAAAHGATVPRSTWC